MIRSGHVDTFARENLPPQDQWPEFSFTLPELQYPERLNCVTEFVDKWLASAAALAAELRAVKPKLSGRTELSHQETWLTEFRKWRGYAES